MEFFFSWLNNYVDSRLETSNIVRQFSKRREEVAPEGGADTLVGIGVIALI